MRACKTHIGTLAPFFTRAREKVAKIKACFNFNKSINQMSATCVINELIIMEQQQKHIRCRSLMRELVFLKTLTNLNRISRGVAPKQPVFLYYLRACSQRKPGALAEHPPLIFHRDGWPQLLISTYLGVCARARKAAN